MLRSALQLHPTLARAACQPAAAAKGASAFSTLSVGRQRMQQLLQQQHIHMDQFSSRWASFEAKVIALVNSCLLAPAGQVSCAAPLCSVGVCAWAMCAVLWEMFDGCSRCCKAVDFGIAGGMHARL